MLKEAKNNQILYTSIFIIITVKGLLPSSHLFWKISEYMDSFFSVIAIALILSKVFYQKFRCKELLVWIIIGLCCAITSLLMKDYYLFITFLLLFSIKDVDIEKTLKIHMIVVAVFLTIHVICFCFMWFYNKSAIPYTYRDGVLRYGFYMVHPNKFSMYLAWTSLEWLYLYIKKAQSYQLIILIIINLFCYQFTDSRSALIIIFIAVTVLWFVKRYEAKWLRKIIPFFAKFGFGIGTFVYAVMSFSYTHVGGLILSFYRIFDKLISTRLTLSTYVANVYGLSMIGRQVTSYGEKIYWNDRWFDVIYLDSIYTALLFGYGVIYSVLFIVLFYYTAKRVSFKNQIFMVLYLIYGFMENYGLNAASCFVPLLIGMVIYKNNKGKIDKVNIGE